MFKFICLFTLIFSLNAQDEINYTSEIIRLSNWKKHNSTYHTSFILSQDYDAVLAIKLYPYIGNFSLSINGHTLFDNKDTKRYFRQKIIPINGSLLSDTNYLVIQFDEMYEDAEKIMSYFQIGNFVKMSVYQQSFLRNNLIKLGIFIMTFVIALSLFIGFKFFKSYLFLLLFSLSQMTEFAFNIYSSTYPMSLSMITSLREFYTLINMFHGITLTLFLVTFFEMKKITYWIYAIIALHISTLLIGETSNIYGNLFFSILITSLAIKAKRKGAILILIGLFLFLSFASLAHLRFIQYGFGIGVVAMLFLMILAISQKITEQQDKVRILESRSAKLENEILRQNIHPHFIMNTLQSIIAWIHNEPEIAVKQIERLSDEFRIINDFSEKSLITVKEEIDLCENYLELMSYRKNVKFTLETTNLDSKKMLPPLIFHTLIENGITHSYKKKTNGIFKIEFHREADIDIYKISNDGENKMPQEVKDGLGFKYIKSRLEEAYPKSWEFKCSFKDSQWTSEIRIKS